MMPRMLQPASRTPRPILGARHDVVPPRAMQVTTRLPNGYSLPPNHAAMAQAAMESAVTNAKPTAPPIYPRPQYSGTSGSGRPCALDVQLQSNGPLQTVVAKTASNFVLNDRPRSSTPGLLNIQCLNAQSDVRDASTGAGVYQSVATSTVTYAVTQQQYQASSASSSPILSTVHSSGSSHSSGTSPAPGSYPAQAPPTAGSPGPAQPGVVALPPTTVPTPDAAAGSEFPPPQQQQTLVGGQMALTASTPMQYSYNTPPGLSVPNSPQHLYSAHPGLVPQQPLIYPAGANGIINHQPSFMPFQYSHHHVPAAAQNGYHHHHHHPDLTHNQFLHTGNLMAPGQVLSMPFPHAYTFPGPFKNMIRKTISCFNCGYPGHKAVDCTEPSMPSAGTLHFLHLSLWSRNVACSLSDKYRNKCVNSLAICDVVYCVRYRQKKNSNKFKIIHYRLSSYCLIHVHCLQRILLWYFYFSRFQLEYEAQRRVG